MDPDSSANGVDDSGHQGLKEMVGKSSILIGADAETLNQRLLDSGLISNLQPLAPAQVKAIPIPTLGCRCLRFRPGTLMPELALATAAG